MTGNELREPAEAEPAITHDAKITFVDVDEGDAILIQVGDFDALVDTGSNGKWDGKLNDALATVS
ncbi:hypothetical protein ACFL6C_10265 [Myxococcota bacterium]